ncbi:MAG: hypothetical protein ACREXY_00565 [Gammaproteobacteria bacterium]
MAAMHIVIKAPGIKPRTSTRQAVFMASTPRVRILVICWGKYHGGSCGRILQCAGERNGVDSLIRAVLGERMQLHDGSERNISRLRLS